MSIQDNPQAETIEAGEGETLEVIETEAEEVEATEEETPAEAEAEAEEVVVSIGDETPAEEEDQTRAPEWVRELRKSNRELVRRQRELEAENQRLKGATNGQPAAVVVGAKPTLEGCDYDTDKFESELEGWHERKRQAAAQEEQAKRAEEEQRNAWQKRLESYAGARKNLKVKDFEDAEAVVQDSLSVIQQGVILNGAENPAVMVYAIGKNPAKAKELAAITDPVKFAFAVAKLETQLKVTPRKTAPPPERPIRSAVSGAAAVDSQLERLREQAQKTGDFSQVLKYRATLKSKNRAA